MEAGTSFSSRLDMQASRASSIHNDTTSPMHVQAPNSSNAAGEEHHKQVQDNLKMSLWKRVSIAMKKRENRKLAACYWALAAAGWCVSYHLEIMPLLAAAWIITWECWLL